MRILLLNQTFHPDVVATAQYASDLVAALASAGHQVTVIASRRAYDHPQTRFPAESEWRGARIIRIANTGLGKKRAWHRAADFATFLLNCAGRLLTLPRHDVVIALTSPPIVSFLASLFVRFKGGKLVYWIMDLNPDEAIAAGWLRPASTAAALLDRFQNFSLHSAEAIVALDAFVQGRIAAKGIPAAKISVLPPWILEADIRYDPSGRDQFRRRHGLQNKFVVMYSGNHSPCHPLDTLLAAALRLSSNPEIAFCFVGGGSGFQKVKDFAAAHSLSNILCLPYEPLDRLAGSLSSADLHVVAMGDPFVGIVHPCKIYNILALGIPFLYIGPEKSHITELIAAQGVEASASSVAHGDIAGAEQAIVHACRSLTDRQPAPAPAVSSFSRAELLPRFTSLIESSASAAPRGRPSTLPVPSASSDTVS